MLKGTLVQKKLLARKASDRVYSSPEAAEARCGVGYFFAVLTPVERMRECGGMRMYFTVGPLHTDIAEICVTFSSYL